MDLDDLQKKLGGWSGFHVLICTGTICLICAGFTTQSGVVFSAVLPHRCAVPPLDDPEIYPELNESTILEWMIPKEGDDYSSCYRYNYNLSECTGSGDYSCITGDTNETIYCDNGWRYDTTYYNETTVSEWDLVCDNKALDSLANSLFFFGFFLGSLAFGPISDWFGRKLSCLIFASMVLIANAVIFWIRNFWVYSFMRIFSGMGSITCFMCAYAFCSEHFRSDIRSKVTTAHMAWAGCTHILIPVTAIAWKDWRYISMFNALVMLPFICIYYFLHETPRWLMAMGRHDKARGVVEVSASYKDLTVDDSDWDKVIESENEKYRSIQVGRKYTFSDLFQKPMIRMWTLYCMFAWFVVDIVFYGLTLNGGNLAGNPYENSILNAIGETLGYICASFFTFLPRRYTLVMCYFGAGLCCFLSAILQEAANGNQSIETAYVWMAIIGKFFTSWNFGLSYAVSNEGYPTPIRATGMGMCSMAARIGGIITPFILVLQYVVSWLPMTIYGTLALMAGCVCLLYPETKGVVFLTTLEEAEDFYAENMPFTRKMLGVQQRSAMSHVTSFSQRTNPGFEIGEEKGDEDDVSESSEI